MKFISKFKLKTMIRLGLALIIALILGLGYISYVSISNMNNVKLPLVMANDELSATIKKISENEKSFILNDLKNSDFFEVGSSQYLSTIKLEYEKALLLMDEIEKLQMRDSSISNTSYDDIRDSLSKFITTLEELSVNYKDKGYKDFGRVGELRKSVHNLEITIASVDNSDSLMVHMLMLRRHEKDYLLRNDPKYSDQIQERIKNFKNEVSTMNIEESKKNALYKHLNQYGQVFERIVALDEVIGYDANKGLRGSINSKISILNGMVRINHDDLVEEIQLSSSMSNDIVLIILLLVSASAFIIGLFIQYIIVKPIVDTNKIIEDIAEGDGDLTHVLHVTGKHEMSYLKTKINLFISKIRQIIVEVKNSSDIVASSSEALSSAIDEANKNIEVISNEVTNISEEIEKNSSTVEEVTASVEELSNSSVNVNKTAENIRMKSDSMLLAIEKGSDKLLEVVKSVENVKEVSNLVTKSITDLELYSNEIEKIVELITSISKQTGLLALNASIEAARAGEHGRGFAVVAEEVRKLADESSQSSEEIVKIINQMKDKVVETRIEISEESSEIDKTADFSIIAKGEFDNIMEVVKTVSDEINVINDLSKLQASTTNMINIAMSEVSATTEHNAVSSKEIGENIESQVAIFEEIAASLTQLTSVANLLKDQTDKFKV